jgi:uncharacterized RDD family membrane protein YckC
MICTYCQSANPERDHRCRRCGRRLTGSAVSAPAGYAPQALGALALNNQESQKSASMVSQSSSQGSGIASQTSSDTTRTGTRKPAQTSLFAEEFAPRVIPFDAQQRESLLKTARTKRRLDASLDETSEIDQPKRVASRGALKVPPRKQASNDPRGEQSTLDFLPTPSVQSARTLKTTVEAVIYCDSPVASPIHRALAALLDASMIFLALGLFLGIFEIFGGPFSWTRQNIMIWVLAAGLIAMFYSFVWSICGRETAGMSWVDLRIINFNGFPPDGKSRAVRLIGCWLSYCSGMIGIFWALMDEEGLTWHDHMSKTFPTACEKHTTLGRQRK